MNSVLKNVLIFSGGAVTGAAVMYFVAKRIFLNKLEETKHWLLKELDEESAPSEKEFVVIEELDKEHAKAIAERKELNKPDVSTYAKSLRNEARVKKEPIDYTSFSKKEESKPVEKKGKSDVDVDDEIDEIPPIRVVTEEYFDELSQDDFKFIGLTYFSDHVLADENNEFMDEDEIENSVGSETIRWIDTHEDDDAIYVVNEILNTAYEIVRDLRTYEDVAQARGGW